MNENNFQRPSLTEIAYEEIKKSICLGKFGPGHKLVIDELIKDFKISNTPIKEALNRLIAEGLVEALPRRGMQVKKITAKEVKEISEIRLMYEIFCAQKAIKVIDSRDDIKIKLSDTLQALEQLGKNQADYNYENHIRFDQEFHLVIVSLSGNDTLIKEYEKLKAIDMAFNNYIYRKLPLKRYNDALNEHKAIYSALIMKDEKALSEFITKHIDNVMADMLHFITGKE